MKKMSEKKFVSDLWKTMKSQEKQNPSVALLHERMEGLKIIGLTGGIASGKSLVSGFFKELGIPVIDADIVAREVVRPGKKPWLRIKKIFGPDLFKKDGTLDREKMAKIVFSHPEKRKELEAITHPEIVKEMIRQIRALKKKGKNLVVIDVPLLFESDLFRMTSKNILVKVDEERQVARLKQRDTLNDREAHQRIFAQMSMVEKEKLADYVIDNSGTREETKRLFLDVFSKIK